ncbi:hypothetical protein EVA_15164 [gut metagenome]|uniref:Uncharacterized protein n=1 Tax=gut metagenome TaxID=749906 RepID=J9C9Z1_9ZZZZ
MHHFGFRIKQSVVHVEIEQQGTITHLFAGDSQCFVVLLLLYQSEELAASSYITAFAHVDEITRQGREAFQTC